MKKNLFLGLATMAVALSSCGEKDVYDPNYEKEKTISEYNQNFRNMYGSKIDIDNQTWDYTPGASYSLGAGAMSSVKGTRAAVNPKITTGEYYNVEKATLDWLTNTLREGKDNRSLGKPFKMSMPGNSFTIVPIYQGQASMSWDLHMVVGTGTDAVDTKIWSKSQGIQTSKTGKDGSWSNLSSGGNTLSAAYVKSLQYTVDDVPVGTDVYFYLDVTVGGSGYATKGTKQSSLAGMMLTLSCPRPANLSDDKEVLVIGCEDANLKSSDWDMNDVVFLVYGNPEAPKPIDIKDNEVIENFDKRYMIEDLGATDDFDFNDIVVDVHAQRTVTYTLTNGVITDTKYGPWSQKASLVHTGGILGFQLTVGDTTLDPMEGVLMDSEAVITDKVYTVTGWNPELNNISVNVQGKNNDGVFNKIGFPKKGDVPMIIAFPTTQKWQAERQSIPAEWFTTE